MLSLKEIESNYAKFSDMQIEQIAREGARGIRLEVIPILKKELEKRGFGNSSFAWIDAESQELSKDEIHELKKLIQENGCSFCNKNRKIRASDMKNI